MKDYGPSSGSLQMQSDDVLHAERDALLARHAELEAEIQDLERSGPATQLAVRRLKKTKLRVKERIVVLDARLFPDIIA